MNSKVPSLKQRIRPEFVLIVLVLLAIYFPVFVELVNDWERDSNYSHGFLVPLVSLFLLWKKRQELSQIQTRISPFGLGLIGGGLFLLLVGAARAEGFNVALAS